MNLRENDVCETVDRTREIWEDLRGGRLFVTGGTGFYGQWLLDMFAKANEVHSLGATATVLSRDPDAFRAKAPHLAVDPALTFHRGDIQSFDSPEGDFTHIIHAAADPSATLNATRPRVMFDSIVDGTRRVLDFAGQCGARKVLFVSSGAVYGSIPAGVDKIEETFTGGPLSTDTNSAYGEGKRAGELLCCLYAKEFGIEAKIARCFATVGPGLALDGTYAIGNFIRDALAGRSIVINSDGTAQRSYIYAADLAGWLWTILVRGVDGRAYNVGSEEAISIRETAMAVREATGVDVDVVVKGQSSPGIAPSRYVPSTRRAREELGLKLWTPLSTAVEHTLEFYREY